MIYSNAQQWWKGSAENNLKYSKVLMIKPNN